MPTYSLLHPRTLNKHFKSTKKKLGTGGRRFILVLVGQAPYFSFNTFVYHLCSILMRLLLTGRLKVVLDAAEAELY